MTTTTTMTRSIGVGAILATVVLTHVTAQTLRQDRIATVQLDDGTTVRGEFQDIQNDTVYIRLSADDERRIDVSRVVLLDFAGRAQDLPRAELDRTTRVSHLAVLDDDDTIAGRLVNVERERGEGDRTVRSPLWFIFDADGTQRRVPVEDLARVYFGAHPDASARGATDPSAESVTLMINSETPWMETGVGVLEDQRLRFSADGEIRLSDDEADVARPEGADRFLSDGPLPGAQAGLLLGRVGDEIFQIGDRDDPIAMPATGELRLGVNDDHHADNAGLFEVTITRVE